MMPGTIGIVTPRFAHFVNEVEVGIGIEEELRDRRVSAGLRLGDKVLEISLGIAALRVVLRVGRHFDGEVIAMTLADEAHQIGGVHKFTDRTHATGRSPQRDDPR